MSRKSTIDALYGFGGTAASRGQAGSGAQTIAPQAPRSPEETHRGDTPLGAPNDPDPARRAGTGAVPQIRTGAVRAIGETLQKWSEAGKAAAELQAQIADAQTLVELDPASVDPAPVRDRIQLGDPREMMALKQSIRESGQQVPILVRPHPALAGRFQIAYGHRRADACRELGIKVKAVVALLTDEQLVIAQGRENTERRDLSFIEIALFAWRLETAGYSRAVIVSSLGVDKADVSRVISVAKDVPETLIVTIGPAPKAGRSRWMAFAAALRDPSTRAQVEAVMALDSFAEADSDGRFQLALGAIGRSQPAAEVRGSVAVLENSAGQPVVFLERSRKAARLTINASADPDFAEFLAGELAGIYRRYEARRSREIEKRSAKAPDNIRTSSTSDAA
ncbi:plasmid partitioning protein RepB [Terrarubrum flagellatum]|uniref:plasmid partitioning protein RepB n=1 Tax=Terrirubrum flagellatum TaxID=2895980 RepID=UPI0031452781